MAGKSCHHFNIEYASKHCKLCYSIISNKFSIFFIFGLPKTKCVFAVVRFENSIALYFIKFYTFVQNNSNVFIQIFPAYLIMKSGITLDY